MKKKCETWPKHRDGKQCGYTEYEDGSIEVAPVYADEMAKCKTGKEAVDLLLKMIINHCQSLLEPLAQKEKDLWHRMAEDYGLELGKKAYNYTYATSRINVADEPKKGAQV